MAHSPHHDHPAVHGMLVCGEQQISLSHLPMFHAPHDSQVLLQVRLRSDVGDPEALDRQDRSESGEKVYTWAPKKFVLQDRLAPTTPLRSMTSTLFRGHFEAAARRSRRPRSPPKSCACYMGGASRRGRKR